MLDILERNILNDNPWQIGIPPCPEQSAQIWRFSTGSCFYYCQITDYVDIKWCDPESLCYEMYTVCRWLATPQGITKTILGTGTFTGCPTAVADCDCESLNAIDAVKQCTPICNQP